MIDNANLRTASLYINNQLLSRGLLRDGETIDFAEPGRDGDDDDGDRQLAESMGRIMGVVNDLILRRDRDAEHREALSTTLRTLRADNLRQANDLQRLLGRHADAERKAALAEAAETAARAQLKAAEAGAHKLREDAARAKALAAQTRATCANEVRKRDRQIEALKKAVSDAGRARGAGKSPGITTIAVTGEMGGDEGQRGTPRGGTESEEYDLRMETNAFLAELAKGLSEENETLRTLFGSMCDRLREMSGWQKDAVAAGGATTKADGHAQAHALPTACDEVASETDSLLDHLKTILTNPSFVPIEEVMVREEEIHRLRTGWEKMENRWKEAVHLIDGWRKRMATNGRPVNIEELKMGLRLSPVRVKDVVETSHGLALTLSAVEEVTEDDSILAAGRNAADSPSPAESLHLVPAPIFEDPDESDSESSIFEDEVDIQDLEAEEPNIQVLQHSMLMESLPLPPPPQLSPLRDNYSAANRGASSKGDAAGKKVVGDSRTTAEDDTWDLKPAPRLQPGLYGVKKQSQPETQTRPERTNSKQQEEFTLAEPADLTASTDSLESVLLLKSPEKTSTSHLAKAAEPSNTSKRQQADGGAAAPPAAKTSSNPPPSSSAQRRQQQSRPGRGDGSNPASSGSAAGSGSGSGSSASGRTGSTTATAASPEKTDAERMPPPPPSCRSSPRRVNSRLPRLGTLTNINAAINSGNGNAMLPPPQSPLTMASIAAKLAASEREADAARVRAKLKAARLGGGGKKRGSLVPPATAGTTAGQSNSGGETGTRSTSSDEGGAGATETARMSGDPVKREREPLGTDLGGGLDVAGPASPAKRERQVEDDREEQQQQVIDPLAAKQRKRERDPRASKAASRRRSTLNPWELESLIQGSIAVAPPMPPPPLHA